MKHPLTNFVERKMCEYPTVFPNVQTVLNHLLYVNGNGYDFDEERGELCSYLYAVDQDGYARECTGVQYLHEIPDFTSELEKQQFVDACQKRAIDLRSKYSDAKIPEIKYVTVTNDDFTEDSLFAAIYDPVQSNDYFPRTYPLSRYSTLMEINNNSPRWLVELAINLSNAWLRVLQFEIDNKHYTDSSRNYEADEKNTKSNFDILKSEVTRLAALLK